MVRSVCHPPFAKYAKEGAPTFVILLAVGWATRQVCFLKLTAITGGAPLPALFEKWPAEPPTPFDSALRGKPFYSIIAGHF
jgi:hypothetical protein